MLLHACHELIEVISYLFVYHTCIYICVYAAFFQLNIQRLSYIKNEWNARILFILGHLMISADPLQSSVIHVYSRTTNCCNMVTR